MTSTAAQTAADQPRRKLGLLLVNPTTGDAILCRKGDGAMAKDLILDGWEPTGPRGQAQAKIIRERFAA